MRGEGKAFGSKPSLGLGQGSELEGESRLVASSSVPVKDSFANRMIDERQGWLQHDFHGSLILGLENLVEPSYLVP